jgi:hypothetical protein
MRKVMQAIIFEYSEKYAMSKKKNVEQCGAFQLGLARLKNDRNGSGSQIWKLPLKKNDLPKELPVEAIWSRRFLYDHRYDGPI